MQRIDKLLADKRYQEYLSLNEAAEDKRIFCSHGAQHSLDVARIAYILWLEEGGKPDKKELIYAAGLLHDIGRHRQYNDLSLDHATESARLAEPLLADTGFDQEETAIILQAVAGHRKSAPATYASLLYRADKLSRLCFHCAAEAECYWPVKNQRLIY